VLSVQKMTKKNKLWFWKKKLFRLWNCSIFKLLWRINSTPTPGMSNSKFGMVPIIFTSAMIIFHAIAHYILSFLFVLCSRWRFTAWLQTFMISKIPFFSSELFRQQTKIRERIRSEVKAVNKESIFLLQLIKYFFTHPTM